MKKKAYSVLCVVFSMFMFFSVLLTSAYATSVESYRESYYTYTLENQEATITDVDNSISGSVTIPSSLGGYKVTNIGFGAFTDCAIESVVIPNTIERLEGYAFYGCTNLKSIEIPDSVSYIGNSAFDYCINLERVFISSSVSVIGDTAFVCCSKLKSIIVDAKNQFYSNDERGVLFNKDKTVLIQYPIANTKTPYYSPETVNSVYYGAFVDCDNLIVNIAENTTHIGSDAFALCDNLIIALPTTLTKIERWAFRDDCNIAHLGYNGTEEDWKNISISENNEGLENASYIHFDFDQKNDMKETYLSPTCTSKGIKKIDCTCGFSALLNEYPALGHSYKNSVMAPSCTTVGYTTYICNCGDSYVSDYVDALGHTMGEWAVNGNIRTRICSICSTMETVVETDSGSVEIEAPENPELDFDVDSIDKNNDTFVLVEQQIKENTTVENEVLKVFDITLKNKDGVHVQPDGTVKVKLPLDWEKDGNYKVYRLNDDGTLTDMKAFRQGSHMVFETDHFSIYVVVEEESVEEPSEEEKPQSGKKDVFLFLTRLVRALEKFFMTILELLGF